MAIRNPRFSYFNMLGVGDGEQVFTASSAAFDGTTPKSRWSDDRLKLLAGPATNIAFQQRWNRGLMDVAHGNFPFDLNRLIVGKGHNLAHNLAVSILFDEVGDEVTFLGMIQKDGYNGNRVVPASGVFDVEFSASNGTNDFGACPLLAVGFGNSGTKDGNPVRIGEVWWTQTVSPTLGVDVEWDDFLVPVGEGIRTRTGASYFNNTGQPLRSFSLSHVVPEGADSLLYDNLIRHTGVANRPFWYEVPCDLAEAQFVVDSLTTLDDVTVGGDGTASLQSANLPGTSGISQYLRVDADAGTLSQPKVTFKDSSVGVLDMRDAVLQVDSRIPTAFWPTSNNDIRLRLVGTHNDGTLDITMGSFYDPWQGMQPEALVDQWHRLQIDTDNDMDIPDAQGPSGIDRIGRVQFEVVFNDPSQAIELSNLKLLRKYSLPVFVEMTSFRRRQVSRNPSAQPLWRYDFEFLEVTS